MYPVQCPYSCTALVPKSIVSKLITFINDLVKVGPIEVANG